MVAWPFQGKQAKVNFDEEGQGGWYLARVSLKKGIVQLLRLFNFKPTKTKDLIQNFVKHFLGLVTFDI